MRRRLMAAVAAASCSALPASARAEPIQGAADIEAVSVGPAGVRTDVFFNARFIAAVDGQPAGAGVWIRVPGSRFGDAGVDRVQRLLTAAVMGRNRMLIVYESDDDTLTAIRLEK